MAREQVGRILVVESDATLRAELQTQLSALGHLVETASTATDALELMETSMPDVLLIGLDLDAIDGFGLLAQAKALLPSASLIALGASHSTDLAVEAMRAGADRCLTRPVRADALALIIQR